MEKGEREAGTGKNPKKRKSKSKNNKRRDNTEKAAARVGNPSTNHSNATATTSGTDEKAVAGDPSAPGKKRPRGHGAGAAAASPAGKKRPGERGRESAAAPHPFPTEYGDHFETPLQAYRDIEGALALLAKLLDKKRKHLRIWDPYYCAGRTPRLLGQLGFPKVEHSNQDFYKVVREKRQPKHDVLITNPPYSSDHKKRCLEYCRASGKPWFLLVPNYVATKDYYRLAVLGPAAGPGGEPFYVVPESKYNFDHPEGTGHADSPFTGVWYVHCGSHNEAVFEGTIAQKRGGVSVLRSLDELSQTGAVTTERRLNPRQRKALKKKRSAAAAATAAGLS
ncbi:unnamed protein product [Ectocarpus fasciculatus]